MSSGYTTVGGYAGTGKTHLIAALRHHLPKGTSVAFCTFTGKAASVLQEKLDKVDAMKFCDSISTIHRLIYKPIFDWDPELKQKILVGFDRKDEIEQDIIIIDEASMVSEEIWNDLYSFGVPIIAVGDHGQLPPVNTTKEENPFNLMAKPHRRLETIHRQAEGSAIIQMSIMARKYGFIKEGDYSPGYVSKVSWKRVKQYFQSRIDFSNNDTITLCGRNKRRVMINDAIRKRLGFTMNEPGPSERLICLNNNRSTGVMNGQLGTLILFFHENPRIFRLTLQMDSGDYYTTLVPKYSFGQVQYSDVKSKFFQGGKTETNTLRRKGEIIDLFDYGYAISVHKAQGTEWDKVILFEDRFYRDDAEWAKWLYTGVTRAKNKLLVIGGFDESF